ncbi:MAG: hypothetical protein AAB225_22880 [Acidobacteriota bacterium]
MVAFDSTILSLLLFPDAELQQGEQAKLVEHARERAAVELAMRLRAAIKAGDPREGMQITKSAMKFDRQIVAIALVNPAVRPRR